MGVIHIKLLLYSITGQGRASVSVGNKTTRAPWTDPWVISSARVPLGPSGHGSN